MVSIKCISYDDLVITNKKGEIFITKLKEGMIELNLKHSSYDYENTFNY